MAGKSKDEILKVSIVVNGNEGKKAINELEQANRSLANSTEDLLKKQKKLEDARQTETAEYKKLSQEIENNNKGIATNITKMEDHRKTVKLTELTIKELRAEEKRLKDIRDKSDPNSEAYTAYNKQINAVIDRKKELINVSAQTGDAVADMENGFADLGNLLGGLASGNIPMIQQGLRGMAGNISSMTKAALTFIATPIGAAIAVIAGIAIGAKKWIDFNLEVEKSNQLIRDLTQLSGESVDAIRVRAEILKESFGAETQDTIKSAKSLVDGLGISYDEAFDIIENGAIRGKLSNSEFLDSLKEYPVQFKNAGFSAKEFGDIVNAGIDLSIYSDKLPDAIKEFTLAVTEQTPAAREALENAFGKEFTGKLFQDLKDGAITPKEALASIADEATRISLNTQQAQLLTADLFKGAGEDAGGALKIFDAVNMALKGQAKPLTEIQKLKKEELETNKKLEGIYTQLFASADGGFGQMIAKGKIFATQTLIKILEGGVAVYNWFVDLRNESGLFSALLTGLGKSFTTSFSIIGIVLKNALGAFKGLGSVIEGVFTLNPTKISQGFNKAMAAIPLMLSDIKDKAVETATEVYDAFNNKNKAKRINLKDLVGDGSTATTNTEIEVLETKKLLLSDINKLIAEKTNLLDGASNNSEYKKIQDEIAALEKKKIAITGDPKASADKLAADKKEIAENEAKNKAFAAAEEQLSLTIAKYKAQRIIDGKTAIEKELLQIDEKYRGEIEKAEGHATLKKEIEDLRDQEKADLIVKRQAETDLRIKEIEDQNYIDKEAQRLEREALAAVTDEEKTLLLLARTQWIANEQLRIEEEKEMARLRLAGATEAEITAIQTKFTLKKSQVEDTFTKGKAAADKATVKNEETLNKQRSQAYANMFGGIAQLLGKHTIAGKAAAIAQATMNTYQGITEVWSAKSVLPEPFATAAKVVSTGVVLASGLGAVKSITKTKTPGYEDGLYPFTRTDGKKFNARYNNSNNTQLVTEPTYFSKGNYLAGEGGPEIIIDTPTLKNLHPSVIENIYATAARTRGYESGNYSTPSASNMQSGTSIDLSFLTQVLIRIDAKLDMPLATGPINIGDNEIARQKIRTDKLTQTRNNAKIK